jgi:hypothetical protein
MAFLLGCWFEWAVDNRFDDRPIIHPAMTVKGAGRHGTFTPHGALTSQHHGIMILPWAQSFEPRFTWMATSTGLRAA